MGVSQTEGQIAQHVHKSYVDMKALFRMLEQAEKDMGRPLTEEEKIVVAMAWDTWTSKGEV